MKKPEVPQKKKIKTMGIFNNQIIKENLTIRKAVIEDAPFVARCVLEAIGLEPDVIDGAIRVSFSRYNTAEDCEGFVTCLKQARDQLSHR